MKNPFKKSSAIQTAVTVLGAGAGSAVVDWLLEKYNIIDENWEKTTVNAVKIAGGAIAGAMIPNKGMWYGLAKSACDGVATVAAADLVKSFLPVNTTSTTEGLPSGTISGRLRMGQRGFRKAVRGVNGTASAIMGK